MMIDVRKLYALPDHWLRRIDLAVALLSFVLGVFEHSWLSFAWAGLACWLYLTNGSARMQAYIRWRAAQIAFAMALRKF
ncbi:hypothetical protein GALL_201370 [mine drainage metagenome]|uniref:Uncharacterized protein n=1 Tax=mine drainage metagenome TaxID=410659 RepID=A0A1J5S0I8_9ZZZZ